MAQNESDIEYLLHRLQSGTPRERATSLRSISVSPVADRRLLEACEALLEDRTITVLSIPYSFGEVRWSAADAVLALREKLEIDEAVVLPDAFWPCSTTQIWDLVRAAGLVSKLERLGGLEGDIRTLEELSAMALLPRRDITRKP